MMLAFAALDDAEAAQQEVVAGALRNTSGTWELVNDQYHKPQGILGVAQTTTAIYVFFTHHADAIVTFVVNPDEIWAGDHGATCGPSVGLDYAVIRCTVPGAWGPVDPAGMQHETGNIWVYGIIERATP